MKDDRYLLFEVSETYISAAIYEQEKMKCLDKIYINFIYYSKEMYEINKKQKQELIDILNITIVKNESDM